MSMKYLYEYSDNLNNPVEAFFYDAQMHPFPVEAHWHFFAEILYVLYGSAWVSCNGHTYVLEHGEMIFLPPRAVHGIYTTTPQPLRYVCMKFDANRLHLDGTYLPSLQTLFRGNGTDWNLPLTFSMRELPDFPFEDFFLNCVKEVEEKRYGYDASLFCSLSQLYLHLLRYWHEQNFLTEVPVGKMEDFSIDDVLLYIDEHSHETISVTQLAEMCHMSYSYFAKQFHHLYGQSCKEYIEFVRLSKVENLLLFTSYDLTYISNETGFSDCSHLIRVFKKKYGITPKQYRLLENNKVVKST